MPNKCTCGLPDTQGVVHRELLPCYVPEGYVMNTRIGFLNYFNQPEGFGLRSERFFNDVQLAANNTSLNAQEATQLLAGWMEAAYQQGLRDMAQDTLYTLRDYAGAVAGMDELCYTSEQAFDAARDNLMIYYTQVLNEHDD